MNRQQRRNRARYEKRTADKETIEVTEIRVFMTDGSSYALDLTKVDIIQKDTRKPIFQIEAPE
jgi:hypothetical protein